MANRSKKKRPKNKTRQNGGELSPTKAAPKEPVTPTRDNRTKSIVIAALLITSILGWMWLRPKDATVQTPLTKTPGAQTETSPLQDQIETDGDGIPILDTSGLDDHIREALNEAVATARARPQDGDAWGGIGRFYQAHMYFGAASHAYAQAQQQQPDVARWPHLLGAIAAETGDKQAAARNFTEANRLDPSYLPSLYALGTAHLDLGQLDQASGVFQRVASLAPDEPWADLGLGLVHQRRGESAQAIESLERVHSKRPGLHQARYALALLYRDKGRLQDASTLLAGLEAKPSPSRPDDPWFDEVMKEQAGLPKLILLANALIEQGRFEEAEAQYRKVLRYDPESFDGHYNLGVLLGRTSRFEESVKETLAAIKIDPTRAEAHFILAMAYFSLGQFEQSESAIDQSLRLNPRDDRAQRLKASLRP